MLRNAVWVGCVKFPGKKQYEAVRFNVTGGVKYLGVIPCQINQPGGVLLLKLFAQYDISRIIKLWKCVLVVNIHNYLVLLCVAAHVV